MKTGEGMIMKQPEISRRHLLTTAAVGVPAMGVLGAVNYFGSPAANARTVVADGWWGTSTTKALQDFLGLAPTGRVESQPVSWAGSNPGPATIRALQAKFGQTQDGFLDGPSPTIRALQSRISGGVLT